MTTMICPTINIRWLKYQDYLACWQAMRDFTHQRTDETPDEIWLLEHHSVFTQGQSGKPEHILHPSHIPVIKTDRGGQVTYHGPGQLMVYTLIDIKRKKWNVREFVTLLEEAIIDFLASYNILAYANCNAPGVYVNIPENLNDTIQEHKICSIGLRIRRGYSYHGLALNVAMNLEPFANIHPCGYPGLKMTQCVDLGGPSNVHEASNQLVNYLLKKLGYNEASFI